MSDLASAATVDVPSTVTVLVPVGSVEQHGPHLPLDTDAVIAEQVARRAAVLLSDLRPWVAPTIFYGASGEHQAFAGTSSIGSEVLSATLVELVRSMRTWADAVHFVNAHGGNARALQTAVGRLRQEGHNVSWVACRTEEVDLHAGRTETSLMLRLRPDTVRIDRAEAGNTASLAELMPLLTSVGVRAVSENGVLGDPTGATADEGRRLLEVMAEQVADDIRSVEPT